MAEPKLLINSVSLIRLRIINGLSTSYQIPDPLPWRRIVSPLAAAEDALARLDERLAKSQIRDGFAARVHFNDACAALWLEGELLHLEDLVLHDAGRDIRAPTHELTRAFRILQARRRIATSKPDWPLSPEGVASLLGRPNHTNDDPPADGFDIDRAADHLDPLLAEAFSAIDAATARADRALTHALNHRPRDPLVYDLGWDTDARLQHWREIVTETHTYPPLIAAAIALDAWITIEPSQHQPWLGSLLTASLLRQRRKTSQLCAINVGLRLVPREHRNSSDQTTRLIVTLEAIAAMAHAGLKDHDRWLTARTMMTRKLASRRSTSRLPALIEYVMSNPLVSAGMIAAELGVTQRAAQSLVAELGLREITGRGRYRAWGIL